MNRNDLALDYPIYIGYGTFCSFSCKNSDSSLSASSKAFLLFCLFAKTTDSRSDSYGRRCAAKIQRNRFVSHRDAVECQIPKTQNTYFKVYAPPAWVLPQPLHFQMPTTERFIPYLPQKLQKYLECWLTSIFLICFLRLEP